MILRRWFCQKCRTFVDVHDDGGTTRAKKEHLKWCGLDVRMFTEHPDLLFLDRYLEMMYG